MVLSVITIHTTTQQKQKGALGLQCELIYVIVGQTLTEFGGKNIWAK
jgi:hypothetical protein